MTKEDDLRKEYQNTRQKLEELEDDILLSKRKGQQILEESYEALRHALYDFSIDDEPLNQGQQQLYYLEGEFNETMDAKRKKIIQAQEDAEDNYRQAIRNLENTKNQ